MTQPEVSLPESPPARKPRRLGLYLPFILLLIGAVAWSGLWFWVRIQTADRMDATAEALRAAGYEVSWGTRSIGGYPFRLNVTLTEAQIREPSGWALSAPRLESEAFMHALRNWVFAAPEGLTFTRPESGAVRVTGQVLRASLGEADRRPPRFDFQGRELVFEPAPGAQPFALSSAEEVGFHLRPGPEDQGALFLQVKKGQARAAGSFGRIAQDGEIALRLDLALNRMSAFHGDDWPGAVRAWASDGGEAQVREAGLTAGDAILTVNRGMVTVGADGRLRGALEVTLREAPRALAALGEGGVLPEETAQTAAAVTAARQGADDVAQAAITFQAGQTTLGPVAIGPAPRVY
ncbi:DUF2125 domain-containing protein [Phenylobacterium sp.]|uniref:DUF2125 domain-containing protein n=1 Tax=Phenylobacterium sp. TaxID=1871053 RepID=UPI002FD8943A